LIPVQPEREIPKKAVAKKQLKARKVFQSITNLAGKVRLPKRKEAAVDLADVSFSCRGGEF
jgi:hypothetical protein